MLRTRTRGHRDLVTVVGHAATVAPGEWITASGEWVNDRTRGKRLVVPVGQKKAVAIAVRNASGRLRWSKLDEWLAGPMGGAESGIPTGAGAQQGSTLTGAMPYGYSGAGQDRMVGTENG